MGSKNDSPQSRRLMAITKNEQSLVAYPIMIDGKAYTKAQLKKKGSCMQTPAPIHHKQTHGPDRITEHSDPTIVWKTKI